MPKSKRQKLVSLTKVSKKTREHKGAQISELQVNVEKWRYCWLFEVGNMRNAHLKTVRKLWRDSARLFFGRGALMAKALGTTPEEEHRPGLAPLARQIKGQVGLLFTNSEPQEVIEWFKDFHQADFARSGNRANRTVILPAGPIMQHHSDPPEPFPHNEEPQLRKLGLTTVMRKGIPTLENPHKLCEKGKVLTAEQAQLLKLIGEKMVEFRVGLNAWWDSTTGEVEEVTDPGVKLDFDEQVENAGEDEVEGDDGDDDGDDDAVGE
ncbi:ribosomal protein L10-domain-containing protein [Lactarius quietus]|nr:ribosomal protein L10-domain-containing protein [Lactarius quietus]